MYVYICICLLITRPALIARVFVLHTYMCMYGVGQLTVCLPFCPFVCLQEQHEALVQELEHLRRTRGTADAGSFVSSEGAGAPAASSDASVQIDRLKEALRRLQLLHSSESTEASVRLRDMQRERDAALERAAGAEQAQAELLALRGELDTAKSQIEELSQVSSRCRGGA